MEGTEINTGQLRELLNNFSQELESTFLERRGKSKSHKESPLEELRDVIKELSDREKHLQAVVGIAKMLLDNNEILSGQVEASKQKNLEKKSHIQLLKHEIQNTRKESVLCQEKYSEMSKVLSETENQLLNLSAENKILKREIKNQEYVIVPNEQHDDELELLNQKYEQKVNSLKQDNTNLKSLNSEISKHIEHLEKEKQSHELQISHLVKERDTLKKISKEREDKNLELKDLLDSINEVSGTVTRKHAESLKKIEELEEEIYILENKSTKVSNETTPAKSLESELEEIELKGCEVSRSIGIVFIKCHPRKNPSEEFFILATQSLKMNSPYIDAICTIPTADLYAKAIRLGIPFNKWYNWIEDELNSVYIQILYQNWSAQ